MAIFNSYFRLPEGRFPSPDCRYRTLRLGFPVGGAGGLCPSGTNHPQNAQNEFRAVQEDRQKNPEIFRGQTLKR